MSTSEGITDCTVLYVNDNKEALSETSRRLEDGNIQVITESRPESALTRLENSVIDCVVSDYRLGAGDTTAIEFVEDVRGVTQRPHPPFILFTSDGSEEIAAQAVNADVTRYIQNTGEERYEMLRKSIENAVSEYLAQRRAERYETVVEALGYPIYVVDEEGRFTFVNDAFEELTGYDAETIVGSKPSLIKDADAVETAENNLGRILSSDGPDVSRFELDVQPARGDPIPCKDHMAYLPYEGEEFRGSVGILRDITDEKDRERQLKVLDRVLRHNLRTNMNIIMEYVRALADETPDGIGDEEVQKVKDTIDNML
ncbi:MAG: PAS domain S-box protein, partial [Halobacteria archaeon]|nr:PAS domain S-box protein [Halobacteria archaeon]